MSKSGLPMISMDRLGPMLALAVAASLVLMVVVLAALRIFSLVSLAVAVPNATQMRRARGTICSTGCSSSLKRPFLGRKKRSATSGKRPVVPVQVLGPSLGPVLLLVAAVTAQVSSMWTLKRRLEPCAVK